MPKHTELDDCPCDTCAAIARGATVEEAVAAQNEFENNSLNKYGYYVHCVAVDPSSPTNFNAHTHGMQAFDNHPDFQIIIPLSLKSAHSILCTVADRVKSGERFVSGQKLDKIVRGFEIKLVEAPEDDRKVLRIVLPDPDGKLEPEEINEQYSAQYKDVEGVSKRFSSPSSWTAYKPKR